MERIELYISAEVNDYDKDNLEPTSISAVAVYNGKEVGNFFTYIQAGFFEPNAATVISGITPATIEDNKGLTPAEVSNFFIMYLNELKVTHNRGKGVVVIPVVHTTSFIYRVLEGLDIPLFLLDNPVDIRTIAEVINKGNSAVFTNVVTGATSVALNVLASYFGIKYDKDLPLSKAKTKAIREVYPLLIEVLK